MKKFLTLLLLAPTFTALATVLTVDNRANSTAQYASISSAISAASNGDTIMVQPSPTSYGDFTVNKEVHIVGPGRQQVFAFTMAKVDRATMVNGSSNASFAGLDFTSHIYIANGHTSDSVTVRNCKFRGIAAISTAFPGPGSALDWVIEGCFIRATGSQFNLRSTPVYGSMVLRNNVILLTDWLFAYGFSDMLVTGNTIITNRNEELMNKASSGVLFENNIFYVNASTSDNLGSNCNCVYNNNLIRALDGQAFLNNAGANNIYVDPDFVKLGSTTTLDHSNDYTPTNAAALTAATDGGVVGAGYGGYQVDLELKPKGFPYFESFNVQELAVPVGGDIHIDLTGVGAAQ